MISNISKSLLASILSLNLWAGEDDSSWNKEASQSEKKIRWNKQNHENFDAFLNHLKENNNTPILDLSNNKLYKFFRISNEDIAEGISSALNLKKDLLIKNKINFETLYKSINKENIQKTDQAISEHFFKRVELFFNIITKNKDLKTLDLSHNCLKERELTIVLSFLNSSAIETLILSNNNTPCIETHPNIDYLLIGKKTLEETIDKKLEEIIVSSSENKNLKKVTLKENNIQKTSEEVLKRIFRILAKFQSLESMNFSDNGSYRTNPDIMMSCLSDFIEENKSIKSLNLHKTNIQNNSIKKLSQVFLQNATLKKVNLSSNPFNLNKGNTLFIKYNTTITQLNLSGCGFFGNKPQEFLKNIEENDTITSLNITGCFDENEGKKISDALKKKRNYSIKVIYKKTKK
jgi:hypothetical protein